jgi:hypothetical protein
VTDPHKPLMAPTYSFCESVHATGTSPWHIRKLDTEGKKLGGGITTSSLCGRVTRGWDLEAPITRHHLGSHVCPGCRDAFVAESNVQ